MYPSNQKRGFGMIKIYRRLLCYTVRSVFTCRTNGEHRKKIRGGGKKAKTRLYKYRYTLYKIYIILYSVEYVMALIFVSQSIVINFPTGGERVWRFGGR